MEKQGLIHILNILKEQRAFDFSGYRVSMLERRIQKRIKATKSKKIDDYFEFLKQHPDELDKLIDVFTINVSCFFRDTLSFEYIDNVIIPSIILKKLHVNDNSLRIWSAGCSLGEEPYSIAIIIKEFLEKEKPPLNVNIFATDIDKKALKIASDGNYGVKSIRNVKYTYVDKYFTKKDDIFSISPDIKKMIQFSFFDLIDKKRSVPSDSIFGDFDIVFCRNVLIYFNLEHQELIFDKIYKSMNKDSYLILGEAETPVEAFKNKFKRESNIVKIYRKVGE